MEVIKNNILFDVRRMVAKPLMDMTGREFYTSCKSAWRYHDELIRFEFPIIALSPWSFEMQSGWKLERRDRITKASFSRDERPNDIPLDEFLDFLQFAAR